MPAQDVILSPACLALGCWEGGYAYQVDSSDPKTEMDEPCMAVALNVKNYIQWPCGPQAVTTTMLM